MINKIREKDHTLIFTLVHSITELHLVYQGNLNLIIYYIKNFTKSLKDYTFE